MATRKRHSPEQVVRKLMTADRLLAEGKDTAAVCRELGVSEATYHRWRNQFGGLKAEDAKRLKDLERENSTLKRLLADAELEKAALKEIARGNFEARNAGGRPFAISSGCWGSANGSPAAWPGNTERPNDTRPQRRHQLIRMRRCGRGCAPTPRIIRAAASGRPITMPAGRAGRSITRRFNVFGAKKGCGCRSGAAANATAPRRRQTP